MNTEEFLLRIERDAAAVHSMETLRAKLKSGRRLKIKLGADPSRPDLHLGHSVALRKLRLFQQMGHEVIFVIGDFTGMIGDPSGRSKTRAQLTFEQTRQNGKTYFEQVGKILDMEKATVAYNSEWLAPLSLADTIALTGKTTLARILERDDFANRYRENKPIGLHEMLYPLLQGYDSVALHADMEVGGTDQTFNLLLGRELQRDYGQEPQDVLTFPLLPGLDGVEKMSKSLDNYIGLDEAPEIQFEKCMKVPDALLETYFRMTTDLDATVFTPVCAKDMREAHFLYAREIVRLYGGEDRVADAERRYKEIASGGTPETMAEITVPKETRQVVQLLKMASLARSTSEARRLIEGGGIRVDGKTISSVDAIVENASEVVLGRGKNKFARVRFI